MVPKNSQAPVDDVPALETGARAKGSLQAPASGPASIGDRYLILGELGRGGMGVVYRVHDAGSKTGQELALKQLLVRDRGTRSQQTISLFEREFYTLAQLAHPRVIAVYDYGLDVAGPFYTMELLDGGDLKAHAPLDVTHACTLMLEVCSSLALLHSRRLVHRDISPRNIRCTHDGHAKLIDFGAMVPMGPCSHTVGTPAFVAPEVVHRMSLDARTDLFSLGATLYYTLTGRPPFAAQKLSDLRDAWIREVIPPSRLVAGIPPALDALCAALLRIDPAQRPRSAFEVMQRLEAIAGIEHSEPLGVSQAYLATPVLIGRETQQRNFRQRTRRALHGVGGSLLFESAPGLGRSRLLDACVLEAKVLGATVLRAAANASAQTPFTAAQHLCEQLLQALPEVARAAADSARVSDLLFEAVPGTGQARLRKLTDPVFDRGALQTALGAWLKRACETHALVIAVDDAPRLDEATIALLAALALQAPELRMLIAITADPKSLEQAPAAYMVLAGQSVAVGLEPLTRQLTETLFESVFGNVPHLALLSDRLYRIALGNPRDSLALAQHLVDAGLVRYEGAQWTLPSVLESRDLPKSAADALATRVAALPALARRLAEAQALLGQNVLRREDYAVLAQGADAKQLDAAILTLLTHEIVQSDGELYSLSSGTLAETLRGLLHDTQKRERHLALYELYRRQPGTHPYVLAQHLLAAGQHEQALDLLALSTRTADNSNVEAGLQTDMRSLAVTVERALELTENLKRPAREAHELRRTLCVIAVALDDDVHQRVGPAWLAQLELDSGLRDYRALDAALDPGVRLQQALSAAAARYAATPESERVYRVDEAIKHLVVYVVTSLVVSTRARDTRLMSSLPLLLEPFVPLSPLLDALWQNALLTSEARYLGQFTRCSHRLVRVYEQLGQAQGDAVRYLESIRHAVAFMLGIFEARFGREAALQWAEVLDQDPLHRVTAMHVRRTARLMLGDAESAEVFRKKAEMLALQSSVRQMFDIPWNFDLEAHVLSSNLAGVKAVIDAVERSAARYPGWVPLLLVAEGHFHLLRGDFVAARSAFERALALTLPEHVDPPPWIEMWSIAVAGLIETLTELGQVAAAIELGERALVTCKTRELEVCWHHIPRALALAEAKSRQFERAGSRIEALIEEQHQLDIHGLPLAASYAARARVAIWARDAATATHYATLSVRERGRATASISGTQVEQLIEEARGAGIEIALQPTDFEVSVLGVTRSVALDPQVASVAEALDPCSTAKERATRALGLLSEVAHVSSGHLYLVGADAELVLAASGSAPPDPEITRFARGFFAQQLDEAEMTAGLTQATHMLSLPGAASFIDPRGAEHRLLMLTCKRNGTLVYAGLAVVPASKSVHVDPETIVLSTALASYLLDRGDTPGKRASDA